MLFSGDGGVEFKTKEKESIAMRIFVKEPWGGGKRKEDLRRQQRGCEPILRKNEVASGREGEAIWRKKRRFLKRLGDRNHSQEGIEGKLKDRPAA